MMPYFRAHVSLSTCRTMNGVIPWTALDAYASRHPEFATDFTFFEDVINGFERINGCLLEMKRDASDGSSGEAQAGGPG